MQHNKGQPCKLHKEKEGGKAKLRIKLLPKAQLGDLKVELSADHTLPIYTFSRDSSSFLTSTQTFNDSFSELFILGVKVNDISTYFTVASVMYAPYNSGSADLMKKRPSPDE